MREHQRKRDDPGKTNTQQKRGVLELLNAVVNSNIFGLVVFVVFIPLVTISLWDFVQFRMLVGGFRWTDIALIILGIFVDILSFIGLIVVVSKIVDSLRRPR